jgi:hypothetical protein
MRSYLYRTGRSTKRWLGRGWLARTLELLIAKNDALIASVCGCKSKPLILQRPLGRRLSQLSDSYTARQPSLDRSLDQR